MQLQKLVNMFGGDLTRRYGQKVHKLTLHGGFSCPNRDGTIGRGGCTFCNVASFADEAQQHRSIAEQLAHQANLVNRAKRYLAYFQAYTSTFAEVQVLRSMYQQAVSQANIVGLCVGTRPDCVPDAVLDLLCEYLTPAQAPLFRAADAALKAGLTGIWLLDVSRADAPERDLYLDALPEGQPLVAGLHEGAEAVRPLLAGRKGRPGLVRDGLVERYVEALDAPPVLLLCGGGHVSLETARLAHAAGFVVDVVDDRAEFADPRRFPMARRCLTLPAFEDLAARCGIGRHHYVAIMTRGHSFDREVLAQALKTDAFYIGMIGSSSKKASVYKALRAQGVSDAALDKVCCPIGLGIGADTPQQIAVSVVAELMAARAGTLGALRAAR